jgi:hypothetical protein
VKKLILIAALFLAACDQKPDAALIDSTVSTADTGRFQVKEMARFRDSDAYNNSRKIFLITDKDSGKEFIGVSGVGISEVGTHTYSNGKQVLTTTDER